MATVLMTRVTAMQWLIWASADWYHLKNHNDLIIKYAGIVYAVPAYSLYNLSIILPAPTIVILRERQLLLRVLKLYVVVNDTHIYELIEEKPLVINCGQLPMKITAKNGFHFSKPFYITKQFTSPLYIDIGCEADNIRLWGGVLFCALFFALFFATGFYIFMLLANLPLFYLVYKYFLRPKEFITIGKLKVSG